MEELIYKLETIVLIREALSQCYSPVVDSSKLIECVSFIDDIEEKIVRKIVLKYNNEMGSL